MPLQKILFKPGINRENTRYTTEGGWYDGDKVRFRQGTPEAIGGWQQISSSQYLGVCRSLWAWTTLGNTFYVGVGTNTKFYVEDSGVFYDITPVDRTVELTDPFSATEGSSVIEVDQVAHGANDGDYVTYSGATGLGGNITADVLNQEYRITYISADKYSIDTGVAADAADEAGSPGGGTVSAAYQVPVGPEYSVPISGWGAGPWGLGGWGVGTTSNNPMRVWSQTNWGQNLVFAPTYGTIYYWDIQTTTSARGVPINTSLGGTFTVTIASPAVVTFDDVVLSEGTRIQVSTTGALPTGLAPDTTYYVRNPNGNTCNLSTTASGALVTTSGSQSGTQSVALLQDVPVATNFIFVSDTFRFLMAFGCNPLDSTDQDRMVIRWADQESLTDWYPNINSNQAGELRLSHGSTIVTAVQTRQEIFVLTDSSAYSLQYVGPPAVWTSQLMSDNISVVSQNCAVLASGVVYWMGQDKFYRYDGRVQTLRCDLREYIFSDINQEQNLQICAGTVESFNEVWWFYCSQSSTTIDRYAVYNYAEDIWYYGTMSRTAWLDSGLFNYPLAATTNRYLVNQEYGTNDVELDLNNPLPINAYITSSEFDIGDGHNFGFVWRILPDITFRGSTASAPSATMTLYPLDNSGSGYLVPASEGGTSFGAVTQSVSAPIEQYTGQIFVRVRGRQMAFKVSSNQLNTTWQLGAPRIDIKPDGRRGGKVT
jgi:hypothetical protein